MKQYILATDACSDLPLDVVKQHDIAIVPMLLEIEGKNYSHNLEEKHLKLKDFYDQLRDKKVSRTSLVNVGEFVQFFTELLKQGKDILYIALSSALSGTYQSAMMAIDMLKDDYPDQRIVAVDTLSASLGEGYLVWRAALLKKEGKPLNEVVEWLEGNKYRLRHLFTVEELGTLKRGGRLSGTAAFFGTLLGVKPILHVTRDGKLDVLKKSVGRKKSLTEMIEVMKDQIVAPEEQTIFIAHGDCLEEAKEVGGLINASMNVKDLFFSYIGPVIGSHSGPGTIAVFFMGKERE
ncbi:MAG TPA: DegV family protein [Bacilli bacterium]|nr:DegV family protein [Bacilli bacterium]